MASSSSKPLLVDYSDEDDISSPSHTQEEHSSSPRDMTNPHESILENPTSENPNQETTNSKPPSGEPAQDKISPHFIPHSEDSKKTSDLDNSDGDRTKGGPSDRVKKGESDETDLDDNITLSSKLERLITRKTSCARKHITVKPSRPRKPRTRSSVQ